MLDRDRVRGRQTAVCPFLVPLNSKPHHRLQIPPQITYPLFLLHHINERPITLRPIQSPPHSNHQSLFFHNILLPPHQFPFFHHILLPPHQMHFSIYHQAPHPRQPYRRMHRPHHPVKRPQPQHLKHPKSFLTIGERKKDRDLVNHFNLFKQGYIL